MNDGFGSVIDTTNEFILHSGENLPNHSMSMIGKGKYVAQGLATIPLFRDRQAAYRYAAWLICMAEILPNELDDSSPTWEQVLDAVRNT